VIQTAQLEQSVKKQYAKRNESTRYARAMGRYPIESVREMRSAITTTARRAMRSVAPVMMPPSANAA
jgi:hypothetical protein